MVSLSLGKCINREILMATTHDNKCIVTCTDNDRTMEADVDRFEKNKFVDVFMAQNNIKMMWNGKVYVGNKSGMEFTTPGPREYTMKQGRGF